MNKEIELRDKLAMGLTKDFMPVLESDSINKIAKLMDLELVDEDNLFNVIKFGFKFQAKLSYIYADEMLKAREL